MKLSLVRSSEIRDPAGVEVTDLASSCPSPDRRPPQRPSGSTFRVLASGALWSNLSTATPAVISVILTPYALHGFGKTRWGLFLLAQSISVFFSSLDGGIPGSVGRFFAIYAATDDRDAATKTLCSLAVIYSLISAVAIGGAWFLAPPILDVFRVSHQLAGEGQFLLRMLGPFIALSLFRDLFRAMIEARQRFRLTSIANIIGYAAFCAGVVVSVHGGYGLRGMAFALVALPVVSGILLVPSAMRTLRGGRIGVLAKAQILELGRFGLSVQLLEVSQLVNEQADSIIVGAAFQLVDVTYFNVGANFAMQIGALVQSAFRPMANYLAQTFGREGREATKHAFEGIQKIWVVTLTGLASVGVGGAYFGITAWLGDDYLISCYIAIFFITAQFISMFTDPLSFYLLAVGRPTIQAKYAIIAGAVNIALTIPMLLLGPLGVGGATALSAIIVSFMYVRGARRMVAEDLRHFVRDIPVARSALTIAVTALLESVIRPICPHGPLGLVVCGLPAMASLALFVVLTFRRDLATLVQILRTRHVDGNALVRAMS